MTPALRPTRKGSRYSKAFKAGMVAACKRPGASLTGVATAHDVSASFIEVQDQWGVRVSARVEIG